MKTERFAGPPRGEASLSALCGGGDGDHAGRDFDFAVAQKGIALTVSHAWMMFIWMPFILV
jgi:hypothetical protein